MSETLSSQQQQEALAKSTAQQKPKGWVRWSGILIFALLLALLMGLIYVFASWSLKSKLESEASQAWGAKVEVASIGLSIEPIGLSLEGIQITDPKQPMQNLLVVDEVSLSINLYHWVVGRVVIEDLILAGLAINQPRKTSGLLDKVEPSKSVESETDSSIFEQTVSKLPSVAIPDAKEVLARESLQTVEQAKKLEQQVEQVQKQWSDIEQRLPTLDSLQAYRTELEQIFNQPIKDLIDLQQRQQKLQALEKRWKQDEQAVKQAKAFIEQNSRQLAADLRRLPSLPKQDLDRLLTTYSLDEQGLKNVTYLLFGESLQQKLAMALDTYDKLKPVISWLQQYQAEQEAASPPAPPRFEGQWVAFEEFDPQPDFMIKRIEFDGELPWGRIQAKLWDVNFDHKVSAKPVRFALFTQPASQSSGLMVEGQSSMVKSDKLVTEAVLNWQGYDVNNWWMAKSKEFAVNLKQANTQLKANVLLNGLDEIKSAWELDYRDALFDLSESESKDVLTYMTPVFASVDQFNVHFGIDGKLSAPKIAAGSDLDKKLTAGFKRVMDQQLMAFKQNLNQQLQAKLNEVMQPIQAELTKLGVDQNLLQDREKLLASLQAVADQKLKQAENVLQDRVEAEKKKLELEARQKIEQQKKKAEDEAKKRLEQELIKRLPF